MKCSQYIPIEQQEVFYIVENIVHMQTLVVMYSTTIKQVNDLKMFDTIALYYKFYKVVSSSRAFF